MPQPLWAPWRLEYVQHADELDRCIFCEPEEELLLYRGAKALVVMNKFPYSSGHLLVAPHRHTGEFGALDDDEAVEVHRLSAHGIDRFARRVRTARVQPRLEHRSHRRCGNRGARAPACRPALERRHELHARARRHQGAARIAAALRRAATPALRVSPSNELGRRARRAARATLIRLVFPSMWGSAASSPVLDDRSMRDGRHLTPSPDLRLTTAVDL